MNIPPLRYRVHVFWHPTPPHRIAEVEALVLHEKSEIERVQDNLRAAEMELGLSAKKYREVERWNCCSVLQRVAVLQCVAVCCSFLQCVAVCCRNGIGTVCDKKIARWRGKIAAVCCSVLQYCSVLHCAAVCCSVLYCVAVCCIVLQFVAVCCSVLQCHRHGFIASFQTRFPHLCCSVLQCVAVCCSVLRCVAVCCSVLALFYQNICQGRFF